MRQPLWIINGSLFLLFLAAIIFVVLSQQKLPRWISIIPTAYTKMIKKEISRTEIATIYENDLFNTYQRPLPRIQQEQLEEQLPQPPAPQPVFLPQPTPPSFLEPLQALLHGVIIMGDSNKNRVMVENKATRQEFNLKVGDVFEDAQLIQIFKNRAIFIRSNGQEEILYLREKDAKLASEATDQSRWETVVKNISPHTFVVDPTAFAESMPTVPQLIQDLDLLTIYKKGQPFGLRVGKMEAGSFGHALELKPGDIIMRINGVPATSQTNRLAIYKKVVEPPLKKNISLSLLLNLGCCFQRPAHFCWRAI